MNPPTSMRLICDIRASVSPCCQRFRPDARYRHTGWLSDCRLKCVPGAKHPLERLQQRDVDIRHGCGMAEIGEAGDAVTRVGHAAGHDACEMRQVRRDIDGDAVE